MITVDLYGQLDLQFGTPDSAVGPPDAPTITGVSLGSTTATVYWAEPTNYNDAFLSGYTLQILASNGVTVLQTISGIYSTAVSQPVSGLTASTSYVASITATSPGGTSSASTYAFTTTSSANAPWDPSQPGVFDTISGYQGDPTALTSFAVTDTVNGQMLKAQPTVGPNSPLRTGIDGNGNAVLDMVSLDPSFNYIQGANTTLGSGNFRTSLIDSISYSCIQGGPSGVMCIRSTIRPTVRASQVAGGGATSGSVCLLQCEVNGVTDGGDPGSDYLAIYTRYEAQEPTATDGQPYNGYPAFGLVDGSTGKQRNGYYYNSTVRTDTATVTSGSSTVADTSITYADSVLTGSGETPIIGRPLQPVGGVIPVGTFVGAITGLPSSPSPTSTGTGFTMVDSWGNPVNALGNASNITLQATPPSRTASASASATSTTISCPSISWYEKGRAVTLNGTVSAGYVGDVSSGSFTLVAASGAPVEPGVVVTSVTLGTYTFISLTEGYDPGNYNDYVNQTTPQSVTAGTLVKLYMQDYSSGTPQQYLLECVSPGIVDPNGNGYIKGACSAGYSTYNGVPNPGETSAFFTVSDQIASDATYSINSDGTIAFGANGGQAVWVNTGGFPHADGLQMIAGGGLYVDHCGIFDVDACPYFLEPAVSGANPVNNAHCRQSYICGGSIKWFDLEVHNGPMNFTPGSPMGGIYLDPSDSVWKPFIPNQVLVDTTGATGTQYKQESTNLDGTRPRGARYVENWIGPLNNKSQNTQNPSYPTQLSGPNGGMIYANAGAMVGSDAQWIKGIQNQYVNVFSTDGITTASTLTSGNTVTSIAIHEGSGCPYVLQPYDVIYVCTPQDANGQSTSRMFVVGPSAVSVGASSINVMNTEGVGVNTGTFPVINTKPTVTIPSGANIYCCPGTNNNSTTFSDVGLILAGQFNWNAFDRILSGTSALAKPLTTNKDGTVVPGQNSFTIDFLPNPPGASFTLNINDQIIIESVTPSASPSSTPPNRQTFTLQQAVTNSSTSIHTNEAATFPFEKGAIVYLPTFTPTWRGSSAAISQSVCNYRYGGGSGYMGMGSTDARTWPRLWDNIRADTLAELVNNGKVNTSGSYTGFDTKGLYVGE
jgi:hypothetical protein